MRQWIRIMMLGLVVASVSYTPVFAQPRFGMEMAGPMGPMGDGPGMFLPLLLRGVGLTAEQKEQVRAIMDAHHKTFPELFRQLRTAHDELATKLLASGDVKAEDLTSPAQRITQLRDQLLQEGTQVMLAVRQVLTPEQLAKAAQIKERMDALQDEMRSLMRGNNPGAD